jgi:hypothetical protein
MSIFADILNGMTHLDQDVIDEARAQSVASDTRSLAPTTDSETASTSSSQSHLPYRTPLLDRQRPASTYTQSTNDDATPSPQTARTAPSRRSPSGLFDVPRTPSMRSQSETGSVLIHRSPSTILPNSSSSSLRSARSVIRLRPSPSEGELPYQYAVGAG